MERIMEKTRIGKQEFNLVKQDMPVAAVFEHNDRGAEIILLNKTGKKDEHTGQWETDEDSGCTIKFKGGKFDCHNKKLLELIMNSSMYENGRIRIDKTDPTGFWRMTGMLKTEVQEIVRAHDRINPKFTDIDLTKVKTAETTIHPAIKVN